jgi:hypothetical protein
MGKWSGVGIPPTRRKLHRLREQRRREKAAADKLQRQTDARLDKLAKKMKVDQLLAPSADSTLSAARPTPSSATSGDGSTSREPS